MEIYLLHTMIVDEKAEDLIFDYSLSLTISHSQCPRCIRRGSCPLRYWDLGFESNSMHECLSSFFFVVLSFVGRGFAPG
jgi:hypothetical protein